MMKLSDYVFLYLSKKGVRDVFMLSGGGCMHLVDSLGRSDINYICCLHEQAAGIAAVAYSQYTNGLGVALVTTGPGGTNAVTAVAGAWTDSVPLIMLSGQVKRSDLSSNTGTRTFGFQEIDIVSVVSPITKYAVTVDDPKKIKYHLDKAVFLATHGRPGPVWLDIPLDVQSSIIDENDLEEFSEDKKENDISSEVEATVALLEKSERPVILAGHGIRLANAYEKFIELVRKLNIPVLTTWKAADFMSDDDPLYFGRPGTSGPRGANLIIQNCDLLISIGARMDFGQIGYDHDSFARCAKKIVVDADPNELKKFKFDIDVSINADAGSFVSSLLKSKISGTDIKNWKERCRLWNDKYPPLREDSFRAHDGVSTSALPALLSQHRTDDFVFSPSSSGGGAEIPMQSAKVRNNVRIVNTPGLGSMGFCVPTAIGLAAASGKKVVCMTGDGGLQMNIQELETIRRLNMPVILFVLNNDGYGSIINSQKNHFNGNLVGSNPDSGVTLPCLKKISDVYSFRYEKFADFSELERNIGSVMKSDRPVLCEIMVSKSEMTQPRSSSKIGSDGVIRSQPLENMWPFLDDKELESEMIIPLLRQ
jgi:acetolactate synthase-1/2/3 large subunit